MQRARAATIATMALFALASTRHAHAQSAPWSTGSPRTNASTSAPAATPESLPNERYGTTPDPAFTHNFQMPTARPLHRGDTMITALGDLGWVGMRYGFARRFDAGIGIPFYVAGLTVDARLALLMGEHSALSLFALATVPFDPGTRDTTAFFGFNWNGAGPAWLAGPVLSMWGSRAGIHIGAHAAQRILMGGLWAMLHMTVEVRIMDSIKAIAQGVLMAEMLGEQGSRPGSHVLVGNTQPRIHPYMVLGARVHSRRFAVDFGALLSFVADAPLAPGVPGIWPWASVSQTF